MFNRMQHIRMKFYFLKDEVNEIKVNEENIENSGADFSIAECIKSVVSESVIDAALKDTNEKGSEDSILEQHIAVIEEKEKDEIAEDSDIKSEDCNEVSTSISGIVSEETLEDAVVLTESPIQVQEEQEQVQEDQEHVQEEQEQEKPLLEAEAAVLLAADKVSMILEQSMTDMAGRNLISWHFFWTT